MSGDALLDVRDLSAGYGRRTVVPPTSFTVSSGGLLGVLGPNGAGKSTLLRTNAGVHPAQAGRVTVDGIDILALDPRRRARLVAYVPQATDAPFPLAVVDVVALGRTPHANGRSARRDRRIVLDTLARLELEHLALTPFGQATGPAPLSPTP